MTELSYAQHAVWFTEQAGAAGDAYRMALAIEFGPGLDELALARACAMVLQRHPVLSCRLSIQDGEPRLVPAATKVILRGHLDESPFDLELGPLTRLALEGHTLRLLAHHLVFDGESKDIFVRELATAYNAAPLGPPPPAPGQIVAAQQEQVAALLPEARAFWSGGRTASDLVLPGLRRHSLTVNSGHSYPVPLPPAFSDRLDVGANKLGVTRFELLLTALHLLLARYGNQGQPVTLSLSTRTDQTRDAIGLFVNDLPLSVAPADGTVAHYACALRARLRELYRFRSVPFTHAVSGPARPAPALTPVSVSYRRQVSEPRFEAVDARVDWSPPTGAARNLLHLLAVDAPDGLRLSLLHDPAVIDVDAVARIGWHLVTVLEHMLDDPDQPAAAVPILPRSEEDLVVRQWNRTAATYSAVTVPELFARHAAARPDALAIVDGEHRLTYAELDTASASAAAALAARGAGPGTRVAICLPRCWQAIVAVLGVLRAGAAYVPVDPAYPALRRGHLLADADPVLVLDELPCPSEESNPHTYAARPEDLAYVIYTSGSTGRPKGVAVQHGALSNLLCALADVLDSGQDARWLGLTSLSFDISVLEMLLPLTTGATLVIAPDALDGPAINQLIESEQLTHVQATPSGWHILLEAGLPSCRVAVAGGEALPLPLAQQLLGRVGKLFNGYGPTENTIYSTVDSVGPDEITIGRPIANTQAYVLDHAGQPAPIGLIGELHLGGTGLAQGYLGQPSLTAERFVANELGRLYRTGDLCAWGPDGRLRYHGRADDQIKIRGHRVEPGEIVARLLEHPDVAEAAVALRDDRLVGYLVATGTPPSPADLRRHVADALPAAMVPTHWVVLDRMPRSPNGKLDRSALPDPPAPQPSTVDSTEPTDELIAALAEIWQQVLAVPHIGPDDDLFDLGGHSLSITRISSRINQRFRVQVPLNTFFDTPTIAEIAMYMRSVQKGAA
ncbi:MAG TPA: amino acid adenylation domain-containing protein [Candidatus Limnocylindrales bacterium]|nr:amino acid adenylation domain-containing protein [Candidatus Limnocylindrales bacterium]